MFHPQPRCPSAKNTPRTSCARTEPRFFQAAGGFRAFTRNRLDKTGTMGFVLSKSMNDSLRAQQEFMAMNSRLQLERQLLMQNQMRERQTAMQIAWTREFLKYFGTFFGLAASNKKEEPRSFTANSSLKLYICLSI
ncbi:plasminogen receptor (KT) isoform X2 [Rissa tridactyla]|uniref:plasminogen receptor (KT) isoform X2 n=1 Tax=Rissa tridactyla TaxID=75485 RepID=UPI0023BA706A|nr:plasminogen receptor (KT) isoform X2 [Rissa tridactyla]